MKRALVGALLLLPAAGCFSGYSDTPQSDDLRVRRGTFQSDVILSGELEAARGEFLSVPALPSWQTAIKWLAEDGSAVKAGDVVVELDNTALTADLETKRQTASQTLQELQQREAEWSADIEQKMLDVEKKKSDLEKAKIDAKIPADLLSGRKYEEYQLTLRRTTVEHEKAVEVLRSRRTAIAAERSNLVLQIDKAQREIAIAEAAINDLVLRAPRAGIFVVRDIPWESRKLQVGDPVWVGFPIAMIPDPTSIRIKAALPDVDDGKIANGLPVTLTLDGYPSMPFTGRVTSISAVAQESRRQSLRRQFDVLIALDKIDDQRMRPGLSARVIVHRNAQPSALLAPRAAIDLSGKTPQAKLAKGEMKDVKLGACNAQDCVVVSGLEEGEKLAPLVEVNHG